MKNIFLLPRRCLFYGWGILLPGLALGIAYLNGMILPILQHPVEKEGFSQFFERTNFQGDVALTLLLLGLYMIGFSKRKKEDEYIDHLRYQALLWTVVVQHLVLILSSWIIGGIAFIEVLMFNLFGFLVFFNLIFQLKLSLLKKKLTT